MKNVRLTSLLFLFLCYTATGPTLATDNWPQFRGPDGNASVDEPDVPTEWSAEKNIVWKTSLPGRGSSCPSIWEDRVFLTAYTGYGISAEEGQVGNKEDLQLHTLCFDRKSGKPLWEKSIRGSLNTQDASPRVVDHGFATPTPATDGEAVYAYFGVSGAVAYDMNGNMLWKRILGEETAGFGCASSPVVHGDLVYINASIESGSLYALNKKTGEIAWKYEPVNRSWSTPCLAEANDGQTELVINYKDLLVGLDPQTGAQLWTCTGIDDYVVPVPVSHEGIVYCLGGRSNRCLAVRLGGRGDVTDSHLLWKVNIGANVTSPVYYEGNLYWASDRGIACCLDAETGETVYRERLPTEERVYASIIRAGDHFYVTTRDEGVLVLKCQPDYEEVAKNVIETDPGLINASPAVSEGQLFLRTDAFFYCIGNKSN